MARVFEDILSKICVAASGNSAVWPDVGQFLALLEGTCGRDILAANHVLQRYQTEYPRSLRNISFHGGVISYEGVEFNPFRTGDKISHDVLVLNRIIEETTIGVEYLLSESLAQLQQGNFVGSHVFTDLADRFQEWRDSRLPDEIRWLRGLQREIGQLVRSIKRRNLEKVMARKQGRERPIGCRRR